MQQFLIVARDDGTAFDGMGQEEIIAIINRYKAWRDEIASRARVLVSHKLADGEGRVLRGGGGRIGITDGPFAETKEMLGGFWVVEAPDYDTVAELCRSCPHLEFGSMEIRKIELV